MGDTTTRGFQQILRRFDDVNEQLVQIQARLAETTRDLENRVRRLRRQADDFRVKRRDRIWSQ
jgi:hypothetical protein